MQQYHKIQTVYLRDPDTNFKTLLNGEFALPEFRYLAQNKWVFTEKVDGTNIRVMSDGEKITFGGKTDNAQIPSQLVKHLESVFLPQVEVFRENLPANTCLYGEGYGAKIQKVGSNYSPTQKFVLFDVKVGDLWLTRQNVEEIAGYFGIDVVPIIGSGSLFDAIEMTRNGFSSQWGNFQAEGVVARPECELLTRNGQRVITKIKTRDFAKD